MNTTQALLIELQSAHPDFDLSIMKKNESALVDEEDTRAELIVVTIDEMTYHDLFLSACGRESISPEFYGVPYALAIRIKEHNSAPE